MSTPMSPRAAVTSRSSRGRSSASICTQTGKVPVCWTPHSTSTMRSAPRAPMLVQSARCTETPRPTVTKPTMSSPGTGAQQRASRTHMSSRPSTMIPLPSGRSRGGGRQFEPLGLFLFDRLGLGAHQPDQPSHDGGGLCRALPHRLVEAVESWNPSDSPTWAMASSRAAAVEPQALRAAAGAPPAPFLRPPPRRGAPGGTTGGSWRRPGWSARSSASRGSARAPPTERSGSPRCPPTPGGCSAAPAGRSPEPRCSDAPPPCAPRRPGPRGWRPGGRLFTSPLGVSTNTSSWYRSSFRLARNSSGFSYSRGRALMDRTASTSSGGVPSL